MIPFFPNVMRQLYFITLANWEGIKYTGSRRIELVVSLASHK